MHVDSFLSYIQNRFVEDIEHYLFFFFPISDYSYTCAFCNSCIWNISIKKTKTNLIKLMCTITSVNLPRKFPVQLEQFRGHYVFKQSIQFIEFGVVCNCLLSCFSFGTYFKDCIHFSLQSWISSRTEALQKKVWLTDRRTTMPTIVETVYLLLIK